MSSNQLIRGLALNPIHNHSATTTVICSVVNRSRDSAVAELTAEQCEKLGAELLARAGLLRELAVMKAELDHADTLRALKGAAFAAGQDDLVDEVAARLQAYTEAVGWPASLNEGRGRVVELAKSRAHPCTSSQRGGTPGR